MKTSKFSTKLLFARAAATALLFTVGSIQAQTSQPLATWSTTGLTSGGGAPPASFAPNTIAASVNVVSNLMKGSGIGAITTANVYGGNNWTNAGLPDNEANSIAGGLYLTYAIQANPGYTISFYSNVFYYHNSATGPTNGSLQYSTNNVTWTDVSYLGYAPPGTAASSFIAATLSTNLALQNIPSTVTNFFRLVNWGATGTAGTWYINNGSGDAALGTNMFVIFGGVNGSVAPSGVAVSPTGISTNYGATVTYSAAAAGNPLYYQWYFNTTNSSGLLPGQTHSTLTLSNVSGANSGNYYVVITNSAGTNVSSAATLAVADPAILSQPNSALGISNGVAQFMVTAAGSSLKYQWYYSDASGNIVSPVANGAQSIGIISGTTSSTLVISNVQPVDVNNDATNFVVVITDTGNANSTVTSTPASLLGVYSQTILTFWDFNGAQFSNNIANPPPFLGVGTAGAFGSANDPGTSPFSGSVDPEDGPGQPFPLGENGANLSWGTSEYPTNASSSNKLAGVQFNVSTAGAQDIMVSYDSRVSATASDYERLQYTSNGVNWIDFPASSTFAAQASTYYPYSYNLTGFPGADNNPNFGIRIVTEWQSTATYGNFSTNSFVGTANNYSTSGTGTVTYDIVTISGNSINGSYLPPTISSNGPVTLPDYASTNVTFTVSDPSTPLNSLNYSAQIISGSGPGFTSTPVAANFSFSVTGSSTVVLKITPTQIPGNAATGPVLVTVTDANGFSASTWFDLTLTSENLAPTNSLTALTSTNVLANSSITIPFTSTDDRTPANGQNFAFSASSANNTVIPAGDITVPAANQNTSSNGQVITITPAHNQLGVANISVNVNDNDLVDPKTTTATIPVMVRPNTNIVLIDYFNYDNSGAFDQVALPFWSHLSGTQGQMQVSASPTGGYVTVDGLDNTENVQAPLLGAPYSTNSATSLYASYIVNMNPALTPNVNGGYFTVFNDGSGSTANIACRLVAGTNNCAPGFYQLGIDNWGANPNDGEAAMFPQYLAMGSNYVVVTKLVVSNGVSTLWVSPTYGTNSPSVTDNTSATAASATVYSISDFELRESGSEQENIPGEFKFSHLKIGTTFDSVFPSPQIQLLGGNVVINWSDPTLGLLSATNVSGPFTQIIGAEPPFTTNSPGPLFFLLTQ